MATVHRPESRGLLFVLLILAVCRSPDAPAAEGDQPTSGWTLVNFWSEWCAPCRKEIPMLNALSGELSAYGIEVVGVNFDESPPAETRQIAEDLGIRFPTLSPAELDKLSLRAPDVMPTTYILAPGNTTSADSLGCKRAMPSLPAWNSSER